MLTSRVPRDRAEAARRLGASAAPGDDEAWAALERASHDAAAQVRKAAAEALAHAPREEDGDSRPPVADDRLGQLLLDADDGVKTAAAQALGARCGARAEALLEAAFGRAGQGRAAVGEALQKCGVAPAQLFAHEEKSRRARALARLDAASGAQQAGALSELGALGRTEDVARIRPFLGARDGVVAAAAARALGEAGAAELAPAVAKLLAEEGAVAAGAADALAALGPEAVRAHLPALSTVAAREGDEAIPAARALAEAADDGRCAVAAVARNAGAAALLARGCAAAPLAAALAARGGGAEGAALARLAAVRNAATCTEAAGALAAPLARLVASAQSAVALAAIEVARVCRVGGAGPALIAVIRRERAAQAKGRAAQERAKGIAAAQPAASDQHAAAPPAGTAPPADAAKLARLMALVESRRRERVARASAQETLGSLLQGSATEDAQSASIATALRAALALGSKGAREEAAALENDADPRISAAAHATCAHAAAAGTSGAPDAGSPARSDGAANMESPARTAEAPDAAPADVAARRADLWSSDASVRSAACRALADLGDAPSSALRAALAHDPVRRARRACAAANETDAPPPR